MRLLSPVLLTLLLSAFLATAQEKKKWTPPPAVELVSLIGKDNEAATKKIRASWGKNGLASGKQKWIEGTTILWGVTADEPVTVLKKDGEEIGKMTKLDDQGLYALAKDLGNCQEFDYILKTDSGKEIGGGSVKIEFYEYPEDSFRKDGVPQGKLHTHEWNNSKVFPDTVRSFQVYIPEQYDGSKPAALMIFQDGLRHADVEATSGLRAPVVFDNLIAAGDMPVTIGVFINPGSLSSQKPGEKARNRGFEYDSLGDQYVTFLLEEIIPFVKETYDLNLSDDPSLRAIAGGSSGASCAWTAAWERPESFGKVLGWVGSFTNLRGAHVYPSLIRKTERKPIRVALLGEANDVVNQFGHWPLANRQMEAALKFAEYDYRYWWGEGFHGSRHAAVMLPEMLRWLWEDVK